MLCRGLPSRHTRQRPGGSRLKGFRRTAHRPEVRANRHAERTARRMDLSTAPTPLSFASRIVQKRATKSDTSSHAFGARPGADPPPAIDEAVTDDDRGHFLGRERLGPVRPRSRPSRARPWLQMHRRLDRAAAAISELVRGPGADCRNPSLKGPAPGVSYSNAPQPYGARHRVSDGLAAAA